MASLLDALGAAANPLTAAVTGNLQGQNIGNEQNTSNMMDVVKLYQQKAAADLARQKAQSEMGLQDAQTQAALAGLNSAKKQPSQWDPVNRVFVNPGDNSVVTPVNQPQAKPENETWTVSHDYTVNGKAIPVKVSNRGAVQTLDNQPVDPKSIATYIAPPPNTYLTGQGADGKPEIFAGASKGPPSLTPMGVGKPSGTGMGGGSLDADSRQKMMEQAKIDNAEMKRIEKRAQAGELNFGTAAGLASAAANAHGGTGSEILSVLGNSAAGALDPDIQKYLTANASYGRIMGNLQSKRYTDNQAQIEKTISGLKGNDLNNTIAYKQQLRDASLNDVAAPTGAGGRSQGSGGGTAQTATKAQQLWDAAVAKHGRDKVLSEYGPRP